MYLYHFPILPLETIRHSAGKFYLSVCVIKDRRNRPERKNRRTGVDTFNLQNIFVKNNRPVDCVYRFVWRRNRQVNRKCVSCVNPLTIGNQRKRCRRFCRYPDQKENRNNNEKYFFILINDSFIILM